MMLLTQRQSGQHGFAKKIHEHLPPTPPSVSRFSPILAISGPSCSLPAAVSTDSDTLAAEAMSAPHRGLPPPAAMTLSQPPLGSSSVSQAPSLVQSLGPFPAPPPQWQGAEESMRTWLQAKSEEDRRKQEEEKTRQESLRLEQRKIERDMLHTSLSGGIPPYMIPMVFAGMGGGNLPNASLEWAQHYMAQAHQLQQQQLQQHQQQQGALARNSPELRRESRQIAHPSQHALQGPATLSGPPPLVSSSGSGQYNLSPVSRSRQSIPGPSMSRLPQSGLLPRLNTGEVHTQIIPSGVQTMPGPPIHPLQQSQTASSQEAQASPSIYFHHWQPPSTQTERNVANQPTTPSDVPNSPPKKRKAQGPQQPAPPPSHTSQYTSPPFSQGGGSVTSTVGRRRHSRNQSDLASRGTPDRYSRPRSRQRPTGSSFGSHSGTSPPRSQPYDPVTSASTEIHGTPTYGSERYNNRQQHHGMTDELRMAPSDAQIRVVEREREPLPSSARKPGFTRDSP